MEPKVKVISSSVEAAVLPRIMTPTESLDVVYPMAIKFADEQLKVFWLHGEVKVEKDIQDILTILTKTEKHGVISTLKLFTLYELKAGAEYWAGRFKDRFPTHELQRMAITFAMFEVSVHKPFYSKINELLFLDNDDFYQSYAKDPILRDRMIFINSVIDSEDDLLSLAGFAMIEGAILYSAFAFLKHFQAQGKNKILNIVRGINFSVRDEAMHSSAGAWTFQTLLAEKRALAKSEEEFNKYVEWLKATIYQMAQKMYEHECHIIDLIFSEGPIEGITALQLKNFVQSRINNVLMECGLEKVFEVKYNPIAEWFYDSINSFTFNDTFSGVGNAYHREWDETSFVWVPPEDTPEELNPDDYNSMYN